MKIPCPLSDADCETLSAILARTAVRREYWKALDEMGLDVSELAADNEHQAQFCAKCKATFFPDKA